MQRMHAVIIIFMTVGAAEDARVVIIIRILFMFFIYDSNVPLDPIGDAEGA